MNAILQKPSGQRPRFVHMGGLEGHRNDYLNLFSSIFSLETSTGKVGRRNIRRLVLAEAVFFGSLDDDYFGFFLVALLRAILGRRTVGLLLRPQTCFLPFAFRYKAKKTAFAFLKKLKNISVFTIVPFSVAPEYAFVADDGLVDPQMWDMSTIAQGELNTDLALHIRRAADGRRVLGFIGTANVGKGIEFLSNLMSNETWPSEMVLPVIAGRFPSEVHDLIEELAGRGALVIDRYISNDEFHTIFAEADFVWACYRPDYDQASGIFGRALQFGKIPIVRSGSLIATFSRNISITTIELEYGSLDQAQKLCADFELLKEKTLQEMISRWKQDFEKTIEGAL